MRLEPRYLLRYRYVDGWAVRIGPEDSKEEQHLYFAEGSTEGTIAGRFMGANHPHRRSDGPFEMDMNSVLELDDGTVVMADFKGYGRAYPVGRRQVVGSVRHLTDDPRYEAESRDRRADLCGPGARAHT
jgi:hypothetical protein